MAKTKKRSSARLPSSLARLDLKLLPPLFVGLTLFAMGVHLSHPSSAFPIVQPVSPVSNTMHPADTKPKTTAPKVAPKPAAVAATPPPAAQTPTPPPVAPAPTPSQQAIISSGTAPGKAASALTPIAPAPSPAPSPSPSPSPGPSPSPSPSPSPGPPAGSSGSTSSLAPATARYTSTNWAGYFMSGATYKSVSGSWTATNPTGNGTSTSADATWIGIGGASTSDLIQVGTTNIVSASGTVSTSVFYELLPGAPVYPSTINASPGDAMTASITETSAGQWTITITDKTTNKTFTTSVAYSSTYSSAEWIQEDPSYARGGLVPFDNFGTAHFTGSASTSGGTTLNLSSGSAEAITMVDGNNKSVATPTVVDTDNASFDVVRN